MKATEIKAKELVDKYESLLFEELEYGYNKELSIQCAIICDEFAIGFLDFAKNKTDYDAWDSKFDYKGVLYNSKELLQIYKDIQK